MSTDPKAEGREDQAVPMYSIQSDLPAPELPAFAPTQSLDVYFPYTLKTKVNPQGEGLEEAILIPNEKGDGKEGVDHNNNANNNNGAVRAQPPSPQGPGCCRRYSCCFPLVIITLIWLMMSSSQSFEHCQSCASSFSDYACTIQTKADYYCKADKIQLCCYYEGNACREIEYPPQLRYSMGAYFGMAMTAVLVTVLLPCLVPCAIPAMMFSDCRKKKVSRRRQCLFDLFCCFCFVVASILCSWTVFLYYRYPQNRCSSNSQLFGIAPNTMDGLDAVENVWIMSQTTYCSFFALVLLSSFGVCGAFLSVLRLLARKKNKEDEYEDNAGRIN